MSYVLPGSRNKAAKVISKKASRKKQTLASFYETLDAPPPEKPDRGLLLPPESDDFREKKLIVNVKRQTKKWTVGPLEFCGVARALCVGKK
ncbi:hypothetical protein AAF712_016319 [Marasmius tenuissimus]|uniref:Uncharacterized protein n=1 Tax=Marasmius tenuissimus TaxID=585030 RepID=A0ABR2Z715_9AGAR